MPDISILIIDPNPSHRDYLSNILISKDFSVKIASSGFEVFEILDGQPPDAIILDEAVKDLTPEALLNQIQLRDLDAFVLIISETPDLERGMDWIMSGAFAYLAKPVPRESLLKALAKGLSNKDAFHQILTMAEDLKRANWELIEEKAALQEKTRQLNFLYELGTRLSASLKAEEIVELVSQALTRQLGANLVAFLTGFDHPGKSTLYTDRRLGGNLPGRLIPTLKVQVKTRLCEGETRVNLVEAASSRPLSRLPNRRIILPLIVAGKECGALGVFFSNQVELSPDWRMLLESVAHQSAQALFNAHQHETALNQAAHDPLTGLLNRRAFDDNLLREFGRSLRYDTDLAIILIDLDHFKSVNDRFGHAVGDEVLKAVAKAVKDCVRTTDIPARIGGEEFAVILPDTRLGKALKLARRLQQKINGMSFNFMGSDIKQTVSQGVADSRSLLVKEARDLIILADHAMYLAKEQGRNTIRTATDLKTVESGKEKQHVQNR